MTPAAPPKDSTDLLIALVPLFQTLLWLLLALIIGYKFRTGIDKILLSLKGRIDGGSSLEFGPLKLGELEKKLADTSATVAENRAKIADTNERIDRLFINAMARPMYLNLWKLCRPQGFGDYEMNPGLNRELFHLRDVGYIEVRYINRIPPSGRNLSDHVTVTDTGREFVAFREAVEPSAPV